MQKSPMRERDAVLSMLVRALPYGFEVEPSGNASHAVIRLRPPSGEWLEACLTSSPEAPVPPGMTRLVVLDGASTNRRDSLRRAGVGFVDLAGAVRIEAPGLYVDRADLDLEPLAASGPTGVDPYSDRASRVVRMLLMNPQARRWTTSGLAAAAEVDVSTASRAVRELRRRELVVDEAPGQGRSSRIRVVDPTALLYDWTRRYSWDDNRHLRVAAPIGSTTRFIPKLGDLFADRRWALSLHAGASQVAPHAAYEVVHVYLDAPVEAIAFEKGWEPSPSGKLVLMEPAHGAVWFQQEQRAGASVVSPIQLVLDLWHYPVRGREQAEHIVDAVLRPIWDRHAE